MKNTAPQKAFSTFSFSSSTDTSSVLKPKQNKFISELHDINKYLKTTNNHLLSEMRYNLKLSRKSGILSQQIQAFDKQLLGLANNLKRQSSKLMTVSSTALITPTQTQVVNEKKKSKNIFKSDKKRMSKKRFKSQQYV